MAPEYSQRPTHLSSRPSSNSRPATRSSSPTSPSRPRSPFPTTLRPTASFSSMKRPTSPSASPATTGSPQRVTATAGPTSKHLASQDIGGCTISSASSVVGVSSSLVSAEGALIKESTSGIETETEAESDDETETVREVDSGRTHAIAEGYIEEPGGEEEARRVLREQLKRSLTQRHEASSDAEPSLSPTIELSDHKLNLNLEETLTPRQYFVLTDAGKPVFVSNGSPLAADPDALASTMGLVQALISVFLDDGDKLRSVNAGRTRISLLLRSPLYYACVSSWGEPESVTRSHLEYLHLQILSVVSAAQLRKIFERRTNFDLRRLLSGAETFLHSLLARMQCDLAMSTASLLCLSMDPNLRRKIGDALVPAKTKDILYVMLIARGRVVTLVRPRKHSVHPADLHILLNTIHAPAIAESPASWLPICLPKFNPGFLHAYVTFPQRSEAESSSGSQTQSTSTSGNSTPNEPVSERASQPIGLGLICLSGGGGGEFETIRAWCEDAIKGLETSGSLDSLARTIRRGYTEYDVSVLGVPGLRHFIYKSRPHVQVTHPEWGQDYSDTETRRRLITLYQVVHDNIHGKSGQKETLKLQYIKTNREAIMGWITQPFELYIAVSPELSKTAVVGAANTVVRWVKREEARLFLRDAPVF
ncbi:MON1 [Sanghuangporus weigelae]